MTEVFLLKGFTESLHPRAPGGTPIGGEFIPKEARHVGARPARGIMEVLVSQIRVDPARFQFKQNVNPVTGEGEELRAVKRFDPDLAGVVLVWLDRENGRTYVVNGHHRVALAKRMRVQRIAVRYIDAPNAHKAMIKGAITNIAEGRGTAVDAAKLFRTTRLNQKALERAGVSVTGALASTALNLANLSPALWRQVVAEQIPIERASVIGQHFATAAEQDALAGLLKRGEIRGKRLTNAEIAELALFVRSAGRRKETIASLFGDEEIERSLAIEKAQLSAWMKLRLLYDKRMFSYVSGRDVAQGLRRADTYVNIDKAREMRDRTRIVEEVWNRLADKKGPLNSALNRAARRLARGENLTSIRDDLDGESKLAVQTELRSTALSMADNEEADAQSGLF